MQIKDLESTSDIYKRITDLIKNTENASWKKLAFKKLIEKGTCDKQDIEEIFQLCISDNITNEDLETCFNNSLNTSLNSVSLTKISNIKNVNALASNQELTFIDSPGITLIYGDNGSGKTGYARILKKVCSTKGKNINILKNVYETETEAPTCATICYKLNNNEENEICLSSCDNSCELNSTFFFDSDCASVHLSEKNELFFTPAGLDIIEKLAHIYVQIQEKLKSNIEELDKELAKNKINWPSTDLTNTKKFFNDYKNNNITYEKLNSTFNQLILFTEKELNQVKNLKELIENDPERLIQNLEDKIKRLKYVYEPLNQLDKELSTEKTDIINNLIKEKTSYEKAANLDSSIIFSDSPLKNIGSETWMALYKAARSYSIQVYPDKPFPYTENDAVCVLCQQTLNYDAQNRLKSFENFVKDENTKQANLTDKKLKTIIETINPLQLKEENYNELREIGQEELLKNINDLINNMNKKVESIHQFYKRGDWGRLICYENKPISELKSLILLHEKNLNDIKNSINDDELLKKKKDYYDFKDRLYLKDNKEFIDNTIQTLEVIKKLKNALLTTKTRNLSIESNKLYESTIFENLKRQFNNELKSIGFSNTYLKLDKITQKGTFKYQITLEGIQDSKNIASILSEGEQKCISLASFLAEINTSNNLSTLIFDDPVCSMDHNWRARVAKRLCMEGKNRQVVIFTHDQTFLLMIGQLCDSQGINLKHLRLKKTSLGAGTVGQEMPWAGLNVNKRIGVIKDKYQKLEKDYRLNNYDTYNSEAKIVYDELRETWERAIEEVLLNETIQRFAREIQTTRLREVIVTDEDYRILNQNMKKTSTYMLGHDDSPELNEPPPQPEELKEDIETLENWVNSIRGRQRQIRKNRYI